MVMLTQLNMSAKLALFLTLYLALACRADEAPKAEKKQDVVLSEFAGTYKFEKDDGNFETLLKETGK